LALRKTEAFQRPEQSKSQAVSQLKIPDCVMTCCGFVHSAEYPDGIRYAQYSGLYKNRCSVIIDTHGPELLDAGAGTFDQFTKPCLEGFNFGALQ
jgi:hypothetical protein